MILDNTTLFSDQQAITATASSTNVVDLLAAVPGDLGAGNPIPLLIQVTEDFNTLTSLSVGIQVDDNEGFTSARAPVSATLDLADLVTGGKFSLQFMPLNVNERYVRLRYTVNGTNPTTGKITAGITMGVQTNG